MASPTMASPTIPPSLFDGTAPPTLTNGTTGGNSTDTPVPTPAPVVPLPEGAAANVQTDDWGDVEVRCGTVYGRCDAVLERFNFFFFTGWT